MERVGELIEKKWDAILKKDVDAYMSTVSLSDPLYVNEQRRWFIEMTSEDIKHCHIELLEVTKRDDDFVAIIHQKHKTDEWFAFTYPLLIKEENGQLKDCGYDFNILEEDDFIIKYMTGDKRAYQFDKIIRQCFENIKKFFGIIPKGKVVFKLYSDQELLRQRTAPTITWKFAAWGEPDEAIKFYSGLEDINTYPGLIQHELVHMVTLDISKHNTASWLTEGIAMRFGNGSYPFEQDLVLKDVEKYNLVKSVKELEEFNLFKAKDLYEIGEWYATCYMYLDFMYHKYGLERIMEVFAECGEHKGPDVKVTNNAIRKVLGVTIEQLTHDYLEWLE